MDTMNLDAFVVEEYRPICIHDHMQVCPQDVKSQDWDETEMVSLQDRDVPFFQTLKTDETETLNPQEQDETFNLQDRDVPKNVSSWDRSFAV